MQVLIIDNSVLIVQRLKELLSECRNISLLFGATSYTEGVQLFMQHLPAVVILDHNLPDNKSYLLLTEIKQAAPETVVIMLAIVNDEQTKQQCQILGADFLFDKYSEFERIVVVVNDFRINCNPYTMQNEKD